MIYKELTRYIINAYNINIAIQFISTIIAMQSSVPTRSCLADTNLNMCLQNDSKDKCETMIKLTIPEVGYFAFPLL
jgi:hypothetical protein